MSQILQNIACFELEIPSGVHRISLEMIDLKNCPVQSVYLFSSTEDCLLFSPVSRKQIAALGEVGAFGMYLNLYDTEGEYFVQDYASENFTIESEGAYFIPYKINRPIDWRKSYLKTILPETTNPFNILLYVSYCDAYSMSVNLEKTATETVEIQPEEDFQDFCLADYFSDLSRKTITRIIVSERATGYLDLKGEKNRLENIPAHFFVLKPPKDFRLVPFKADLSKSFYRHRSFSREPIFITLTYML